MPPEPSTALPNDAVQTEVFTSTDQNLPEAAGPWPAGQRVLFRFASLYFVLYAFSYPMSFFPFGARLTSWPGPIWDAIVSFTGTWFFTLPEELLKRRITGSGDTTFDYVQLFSLVLLALLGTALWSLLDRRRLHYRLLAPWLSAGVRFFVGAVILFYGFGKVFHLQFPAPSLTRLVTTYGDSSPMGLAWTFVGASAAYSMFAGLGEVVGGLLLFFRRTTTLGALLLVGVMGHVVMLNFCFDIPVKLFSSHLLIFALALLAPEARRLAAFVMNRATSPPTLRPLFEDPRRQRIAAGVKGLCVLILLVFNVQTALRYKKEDSVKPPLYGIHEVESFVLNQEERPPLLTDDTRWRSVIFYWPGRMAIQGMDGVLSKHSIELDLEQKSLVILGLDDQDPEEQSLWTVETPKPGTLILHGQLGYESVRILTREKDAGDFTLVNRGFRWINEAPFNR